MRTTGIFAEYPPRTSHHRRVHSRRSAPVAVANVVDNWDKSGRGRVFDTFASTFANNPHNNGRVGHSRRRRVTKHCSTRERPRPVWRLGKGRNRRPRHFLVVPVAGTCCPWSPNNVCSTSSIFATKLLGSRSIGCETRQTPQTTRCFRQAWYAWHRGSHPTNDNGIERTFLSLEILKESRSPSKRPNITPSSAWASLIRVEGDIAVAMTILRNVARFTSNGSSPQETHLHRHAATRSSSSSSACLQRLLLLFAFTA